MELGSVWARLGADVTVVEFLPRIALGFDLELARGLQKGLEADGLKFHLEAKVEAVTVKDGLAFRDELCSLAIMDGRGCQ